MKRFVFSALAALCLSVGAFGQSVPIPGGGRAVRAPKSAPTDGQFLQYNAATKSHVYATVNGGTVPTGTGFNHVTGGAQDAAARAVNLGNSDVTGTTPIGNGGTGQTTASAAIDALNQAAEVSIASAATVDLSGPGQLVLVTGSSGPITSFGTVVAGTKRWLRFASTPTITYNATSMILPTSANITVAAGDTLVAISQGSGNWIVYNYQRRDGTALTGAGSISGLTSGVMPVATSSTTIGNGPISVSSVTNALLTGQLFGDSAKFTNALSALSLTLGNGSTAGFDAWSDGGSHYFSIGPTTMSGNVNWIPPSSASAGFLYGGTPTQTTNSPLSYLGASAAQDNLITTEQTIASATTTDLGTLTSDNVQITGTTTITGLGSSAPTGKRYWVRFAASLTLTYNATSLIIPGAANVTTAANDRMLVRHLGSGNWIVLDYVKADGTPVVGGGSISGLTLDRVPAASGSASLSDTTLTRTEAGNLHSSGVASQSTANGVVDALATAEATVASATTTDLGAVTSQNVQITGTTTITSFGTKTAGTIRRGRFAGVLTLTHNATSLILPGAANITTAANDTFEAVSLGAGNWLVYFYQKASGAAITSSGGGGTTRMYDKTAETYYETWVHGNNHQGLYNWFTTSIGTGSGISVGTPTFNHPSTITIGSGGTPVANDGCYVSIGDSDTIGSVEWAGLNSNGGWTNEFDFQLSATTTIIFYGGFVGNGYNSAAARQPANYVAVRYDTTLSDTQFVLATRTASGTPTTANLGAVDTNWHHAIIWCNSGEGGTIRGQLDSGTAVSITTTIPTVNWTEMFGVWAASTTQRTGNFDDWFLEIHGLSR